MEREMVRMANFIDLPICELHKLGELAELVSSVRLSRLRNEKLAMALKSGGYIPRLLEIFQVCESEKNIEGLHHLFDVMRGILYLDKAILFEVMFSDECILGVLGCLEYDPCSPQPGQYRESLTEIAKLHDIIPVKDPELRKKIRQTFRAHYVQAIITPNLPDFEEGFLSGLDSFVTSSKEEILLGLKNDEEFLPEVLARLKSEATDGEQRRELMKFFKEFCAFSFILSKKRKKFVKTLGKLGFLPTIKTLMAMDDKQVRSAAKEILSYLVTYNPYTVQEFVMQEARQNENGNQLLIQIIEQMIHTPDPELGGDEDLMDIFRDLIDPRKMLAVATNLEIFEFLDTFYDRYIHILTMPLTADTSENWYEIDNYQTAEILASVLELLSFCVKRHRYHMKMYLIKKNLLKRILVLLKSKHKFLALSALRFLRGIIGLRDELYNHYITMENLLEPVVNVVLENKNRCNLLKSASLELFEFIRTKDVKFLIAHIVEKFSDALEPVKPFHTFQGLKTKYEEEKARQNEEQNSVSSTQPAETFVKAAAVSQVDEDPQLNEGEEKTAPTSPPSSDDFQPIYTTLTTVVEAPKRGLSEIFALSDDEDDEASPKKRARLDF